MRWASCCSWAERLSILRLTEEVCDIDVHDAPRLMAVFLTSVVELRPGGQVS